MNDHELEARILHDIRETYGKEPDLTLWRNTTGGYQVSNVTPQHLDRMLMLLRANRAKDLEGLIVALLKEAKRFIRYGLVQGGSDLVGILHPGGRWMALEAKTEAGRLSVDQRLFLKLIRHRGGFAAVVRSVEEAGEAIGRARRGERE